MELIFYIIRHDQVFSRASLDLPINPCSEYAKPQSSLFYQIAYHLIAVAADIFTAAATRAFNAAVVASTMAAVAANST